MNAEKLPAASDLTAAFSPTAEPISIVVPAGEGTTLEAFNNILQVKLNSQQTQGSLAVALVTVPPESGPPPHMHHKEDELFLILDGQFRFLINGQWTESFGTGTVVYLPHGAVHTFQNSGNTIGRFWTISTPGGFEQFFARCADVFSQPGPPDIARIVAISSEHDIEYVPALSTSPK